MAENKKTPLIAWKAILFLLAFLHLQSQAQQSVGVAPCGVPVFVYSTGAGGMSMIFNGMPVIFLDPPVWAGDPALREFTIFHECGHHVLGHTLPNFGNQNPWFRQTQELAADCYAAQNVSPPVVRRVAQMFSLTQGNFSPAPGYPTGNQRAQNILQCAGP